jgi:hypothetical protein
VASEVEFFVDCDAQGNDDGSSWADAYIDLVSAYNLLAKDLTSSDEIYILTIRNSGGGAFDFGTFDGFTTDLTRKVIIRAAEGYEAVKNGWDDNRARLDEDDSTNNFYDQNIDLEGLQIRSNDTLSGTHRLAYFNNAAAGAYYHIDNCRFESNGGASGTFSAIYLDDPDCDSMITNTIVRNVPLYGLGNDGECRVYNSIFVGANNTSAPYQAGIGGTQTSDMIVKNCAVFNNTNDFDYYQGVWTVDYCASDDGDGTNTVSPFGGDWDNEFVDWANGDFTLLPTGNLYQGGTDNPSSGYYSTDMQGDAYNSPWDIGVDSYTVEIITDLYRYVDYNLSTGDNDGTSWTDAFRGTDALYDAITNMDNLAKQCTTNNHRLHIVIKGLGKTNTNMTASVLDNTWLTDNQRYVEISIDAPEKHSGYIDTDKFLFYITGNAIWWTQTEPQNLRFKNIQFRFHKWGGFQLWSGAGLDNQYRFNNCIFDNKNSPRYTVCFSCRGFDNINADFTAVNCVFADFNKDYPDTHGCINFSWQTTLTYMYFHNCQFNNVTKIIYDDYSATAYGVVEYINCIFDNVDKMTESETDTYITEAASCKNNSSNTLVGPSVGANNIYSQTFDFEPGVADSYYKVTSEDTGARAKGFDNSASGYTTDILGVERLAPWDIGAFYIAPPVTPEPTPEVSSNIIFSAACIVNSQGEEMEF